MFCLRKDYTNRLDVVSASKASVTVMAVVVFVNLMLLALLFGGPGLIADVALVIVFVELVVVELLAGGPGLVADATLVLEVVLAVHVLDSGGFRVEPAVTPIALVGRTVVAFRVTVILASLPRGEGPPAGATRVLPRHLALRGMAVGSRFALLGELAAVTETNC